MKAMRLWQGVRMRQVAAAPEPDQPERLVTLPVTWDDRAAQALAALLPGPGPVSLAAGASVWLGLIAARARQVGRGEDIVVELQRLLHRRQASPNAAIWRGETGTPGYCLNVAAFYDPASGFDSGAFARAAGAAAHACRLLAPCAQAYAIGVSGLDDLLARAGLPYDSPAARDVAACLAALLRASVDRALEGEQRDLLATGPDWPAPPAACALPGLAEAARGAWRAVRQVPGANPATGVFPPGPADALLGVETGGIAPAFSPVRDQHLTRAAQDRLAAASLSPEAALARVLEGESPFSAAGQAAYDAMRQAVAPFLERVEPVPTSLPSPCPIGAAPSPAIRRKLPPRPGGMLRRVQVGGHPVALRTAEFEDGRLGEISLSLPRESAAVRGLAECFAQAVSLGLQHGVALEEFVDAFALTSFGPSGAVQGDSEVERATSVLDYVFREVSATYLHRTLPPIAAEDPPPSTAPLLPLDLPPKRRALRLVA